MLKIVILSALCLILLSQSASSLKCNTCTLEEACNKAPVTCPQLSQYQQNQKLRPACVTVTGKAGAKTVLQAKKCDVDKWAIGEDACAKIKNDVASRAIQAIQDVKCSMCYTDNCNS